MTLVHRESTNFSTIGGTINSGRSIERYWQAFAASFKCVLVNIEINAHSFTQLTKSVMSCSVNRWEVGGMKYQIGLALRSLEKDQFRSIHSSSIPLTDELDRRMLEPVSKGNWSDLVGIYHYSMDDRSSWSPWRNQSNISNRNFHCLTWPQSKWWHWSSNNDTVEEKLAFFQLVTINSWEYAWKSNGNAKHRSLKKKVVELTRGSHGSQSMYPILHQAVSEKRLIIF